MCPFTYGDQRGPQKGGHLSIDLNEMMDQAMEFSRGIMFQAKRIANTEALKWENTVQSKNSKKARVAEAEGPRLKIVSERKLG